MIIKIFLTFLTSYPISEKLFEKYIYFLVKNLEYQDYGESPIILDILKILIEQLPQAIIDHYVNVLSRRIFCIIR